MFLAGNAYIMVPPKNTTANEGTRVKLSCQAEGYPNNITYRWFKNGVDIQQVPGLMTRAGVYADGSFVISTVIKEDTGWYKCRPSNGLGPPPEAQAYLNVTCEYHATLVHIYQSGLSHHSDSHMSMYIFIFVSQMVSKWVLFRSK